MKGLLCKWPYVVACHEHAFFSSKLRKVNWAAMTWLVNLAYSIIVMTKSLGNPQQHNQETWHLQIKTSRMTQWQQRVQALHNDIGARLEQAKWWRTQLQITSPRSGLEHDAFCTRCHILNDDYWRCSLLYIVQQSRSWLLSPATVMHVKTTATRFMRKSHQNNMLKKGKSQTLTCMSANPPIWLMASPASLQTFLSVAAVS